MNKKTVITLMLALKAMTAQTQTNKDSIYVYGIVADGFTKAAVPDAFVTLMCQDSTVIDTISVHDSHTWVSGVQRTRRGDARRTHPTAAGRGTD